MTVSMMSVLLLCTSMIEVNAQDDVIHPVFYAIGEIDTKLTYGQYKYLYFCKNEKLYSLES